MPVRFGISGSPPGAAVGAWAGGGAFEAAFTEPQARVTLSPDRRGSRADTRA